MMMSLLVRGMQGIIQDLGRARQVSLQAEGGRRAESREPGLCAEAGVEWRQELGRVLL